MGRTQKERREESIGRLLQASIDTIIEVGYARASAAVITRRAGMSVGGLFRHFETMGQFMAATAHEVANRQLEEVGKRFAEIPADRVALEAALEIVRDVTGSPLNAVLYELMIAARTDEKLTATLRDVLEHYSVKIYEAARALPGTERVPEETFPAVVALFTNVFDGAALVRGVLPQPEIEEQRIPVLLALLSGDGPNRGLWVHDAPG